MLIGYLCIYFLIGSNKYPFFSDSESCLPCFSKRDLNYRRGVPKYIIFNGYHIGSISHHPAWSGGMRARLEFLEQSSFCGRGSYLLVVVLAPMIPTGRALSPYVSLEDTPTTGWEEETAACLLLHVPGLCIPWGPHFYVGSISWGRELSSLYCAEYLCLPSHPEGTSSTQAV